ncbi:hypothetical protein EC957_002244 [Mortierella hygrophila]|uniref:Galactose oxidase n=1 Tax=Mortierella hygrophila TaxID=979708 RepID=A0A9P6K1C3_9FUNG|nr:hypothetical protein EC957_002244 [Mortierella hygrophila]
MTILFSVALSMLAALACAQPQNVPPRTTRAITLIGDNLYLYGGSSSGGDCYSDMFSLNLNPAEGWVAPEAKWNSITTSGDTPVLGAESWAVGAANGLGLLVYGQSLCPQNLDKSANPPHTYTSSSGSALFQNTDGNWGLVRTGSNIFGNRSVVNDQPVPVQVIDAQGQVVYTFEYDFFNPQLGMQLWSFPTGNLPTNIAGFAKNTTMLTSLPPTPVPLPPTNGTNATVPAPPAPVKATLAPWIDVGSAVFVSGTIVVVGGGKDAGERLTGDNYDAASGYLKMDRCWVYTIATNEWAIRNLTGDGGSFPLPRRLHALAVVGSKIYMHGGNTTQTIPTDSYASDMWILDTQTWTWTTGPSSSQGRAQHTLVFTNNNLLAVSGFQFLTSPTKGAQNSFISIYDLATSTWGFQFGTVNETYFQKHGAAIIGGSIAGFLVLVVTAAVVKRLLRRRRGPRKSAGTMIGGGGPGQSRSFKPFLVSSNNNNATAGGAASQLSGITLNNNSHQYQQQQQKHQRPYETEIDLSSMPRASESTVYPTYNPYDSTKQQQQVPLMSANALEQQGHTMDPYADEDVEEKDAPINLRMPAHGQIGSPESDHGYLGQTVAIPEQTVGVSGAPVRSERAIHEDSVGFL